MPGEKDLEIDSGVLDYGELDNPTADVDASGSGMDMDSSTAESIHEVEATAMGTTQELSPGYGSNVPSTTVAAMGTTATMDTGTASGVRELVVSAGGGTDMKTRPSSTAGLNRAVKPGMGTTQVMATSTAEATTALEGTGLGTTLTADSYSNTVERNFQPDSIAGVAQDNDSVMERLDYPFPKRKVRVDEEPYQYSATRYDDGTSSEQTVYILRKAPVNTVRSVSAQIDGSRMELMEGTDYEIIDSNGDNEPDAVDFDTDGGLSPDFGSTFYVSYEADSVISRYTEGIQEEFDQILPKVNYTVNSYQVTNAQDEDLDEIGKQITDIGKRRDRNDLEYRTFLKSLPRAFKGRGTIDGVRYAISTATIGGLENISLREDTSDNSYQVVLRNWTAHRTRTIDNLSELSDPSGVERIPPIVYDNPNTSVRIFSAPTRATGVSIRLPKSGIRVTTSETTIEKYTDGLGSGYLGSGNLSVEDDMSIMTFDKDSLDSERIG